MQTTSYAVHLRYTRAELLALFALARSADVEHGGRYDARGGALNIWSHAWTHPALWDESALLGSFAVNWVTETLWRLDELGALEIQALGRVKHGTQA